MSYPVQVCLSWKTLPIYLLLYQINCEIPPWLERGMKHFLYECENFFLADCNLKTLRESPKRTISTSGELGLLQMVSELDTGLCVNKEVEPQRG